MGDSSDSGQKDGDVNMNIQEAKEEIIRSVRAYTAKDESGCYRIPVVQQRPVLLMGPPGIGKTAIMEQAASECGVGLLAYTITHHTRQSAVGLPQLVRKQHDGVEYTMTEYTMSEIVGSIYEYQERTGLREGILFIDEINCVSETLAPTMLQFLQYKTFGNHRVPDGWIIVAAGNPPEYNRSVRELDMAALDRVRLMEVEADYEVWRAYAGTRGIHPAVLSYLELHPEHFYQVILTHDRREFVTARGWEDLSVLLTEYERQELLVNRSFMEEFLRIPRIAADFTSYYEICKSLLGMYRIRELAAGELTEGERVTLAKQLSGAPGDVRCMFVRHLLSAASEQMTDFGRYRRYCAREKEVLEQYDSYSRGSRDAGVGDFLKKREHALRIRRENGLLKPWEEQVEKALDQKLVGLLTGSEQPEAPEQLRKRREKLYSLLEQLTDFIEQAFGQEMELAEWMSGLGNHGDYKDCGFSRPDLDGFLEHRNREEELRKKIKQMEDLYETTDRI